MNMQNILNQFTGSNDNTSSSQTSSSTSTLSGLVDKIPGGLMGGAAAGGIMALLVGNKSARKVAGKAATYGGAAVLGGLALKAFQNYKSNSGHNESSRSHFETDPQQASSVHSSELAPVHNHPQTFEMTLIKAMIAAAKADGHIDDIEQKKIFDSIAKSDLSSEQKSMVFDCFQREIEIHELIPETSDMEMCSEIYLASYLVIEPDLIQERYHLDQLAQSLGLPHSLVVQLETEAKQALQHS